MGKNYYGIGVKKRKGNKQLISQLAEKPQTLGEFFN